MQSSEQCVLAIQETHAAVPPTIFGLWFFRNFYVVFDFGQSRVGFAGKDGGTVSVYDASVRSPSITQLASSSSGPDFVGPATASWRIVLLIGLFGLVGVVLFTFRARRRQMRENGTALDLCRMR